MSETVLYVEDSPDDVFLMQRAFGKIVPSCELQVITNGQEAADFFTGTQQQANPKPLPLVLLDLNLPGQSGLQVLTKIRTQSKYSAVPVIIFSASNQQKDIESCYKQGCNAYVVKPNDPDSLKSLVSLITEFWLKKNCYSLLPAQ